MMKTLDRTTTIILMLVGVALFISTFSSEYDIEAFGGDVSTVFVPRVYFIIWIVLTLVFMWQTKKSKSADGNDHADNAPVSFARLCVVMIISAATSVAMLKLGFIIGLVPGFFMFCWAFGYRKPLPLAIISVLGAGTVWIVFNNLFELTLPRSPWFNLF